MNSREKAREKAVKQLRHASSNLHETDRDNTSLEGHAVAMLALYLEGGGPSFARIAVQRLRRLADKIEAQHFCNPEG